MLHLPLVWIPVQSLRHFFMLKAVIAPIAGIAYCAWACSRAGGLGSMLSEPAQSSGSNFSWAWIDGMMSSIANVRPSSSRRPQLFPVASLVFMGYKRLTH